MQVVQFIKWKNIWTKNEWVITIWIETNEQTFNALRLNRNSVLKLNISYQDFNSDFSFTISNEWSSIIWKEDHWVFKIDIIGADIIPPIILINWLINIYD